MPLSCMFPGCGLKAKRYNPESFHELPYRYNDRELLQQWLLALNMDIMTPVDMLIRKRYRVCSRHFHKDDFIIPVITKECKRLHRVRSYLKKNAIPRELSAEESSSAGLNFRVQRSESIAVPQCTQRKTQRKTSRKQKSSKRSTVILTVSNPDQTSSPCTYLARPPILELKEDPDSMMSDMCIIQGCNGTEELLSFPKDPSTLQQWMLCLNGRLKHPVNSSSKVCSAHFTSDSSAYWHQKQSGVAKIGSLPSHFTEVHNEQVELCPQERTSDGDQWDLQQTWLIEDTGLTRSTLPRTHSKDTNKNSSNMQGRDALMTDIVVNLACLLQLFQKCLKCCSDACSVSVRRKAPIIHVLQRCWSCGNTREWTNQQQSIKASVQLPPDPVDSLETCNEPIVTSKGIEAEITVKIEEEEMEGEVEEEVEEESKMTDEEEAEMEEEEEEKEQEEENDEQDKVREEKPKNRKRRDSDGEWAPDDGVVTETSEEETEEEEEEEDDDDEVERPHRGAWCSDCGKEASTDCIRQKHLQLYCCNLCGYRDGYQEPKNSELLETQRISSPETPSAGHQEGTDDVGQSAESSCSPEDDGNNNKSADSSDGPEDPNSCTSHHATTNIIKGPLDSGVDASTCCRDDHIKEVCTRGQWGTNQDSSASQLGSNNNHQQTSAKNQDKQKLPAYAVYFTDLCSLQRHMKRSHSGKRRLCPNCGLFCLIRDGKTAHVCDLKGRPFKCSKCGRGFRSNARLQLHIQFHDEDFRTKCRYCYETFKQKEDKDRHLETHIGENLKYRCPECPKRFSNQHNRKGHISTAHFKHGRFVCKICDKSFHIEFKLKRHEMVHTGVKPFRCDQCDRSFNQPGHLKSHMRVHTGERPFMCHECGQCFNHNVSLKNHVQRNHRSAPDDDWFEDQKQ